jgi:putative alpha-1,2-mannosidase
MFGTGPGGLPGNDDSGGLSAWVVWASLGMFPVAGQDLVLLNAPAWPEARIALPGDRELVVQTSGFRRVGRDTAPQYVRSMRWNGTGHDASWLPGTELRRGGTLEVELGDEPGDWGRASRPPSHPSRTAPPAHSLR